MRIVDDPAGTGKAQEPKRDGTGSWRSQRCERELVDLQAFVIEDRYSLSPASECSPTMSGANRVWGTGGLPPAEDSGGGGWAGHD
jgi:hypothetical protein